MDIQEVVAVVPTVRLVWVSLNMEGFFATYGMSLSPRDHPLRERGREREEDRERERQLKGLLQTDGVSKPLAAIDGAGAAEGNVTLVSTFFL